MIIPCEHKNMKVVINAGVERGRFCPDCGYISEPTPGDKIRESLTAIGSQFADLGFRVEVNPIYGPGNNDYGRYKPFSPPDLTPEQLESLRKSLAEATVTSMTAKPLSANAELFKLLHDEDECHPGIICLDEMVRLHREEADSWRSKVVWGFHEDAYPQYIQGKAGENEITSELTADEANRLVKRSIDLERELADIASAIGSDEFMDPPDGGSVTLAEQVRRMREALTAERKRHAQ